MRSACCSHSSRRTAQFRPPVPGAVISQAQSPSPSQSTSPPCAEQLPACIDVRLRYLITHCQPTRPIAGWASVPSGVPEATQPGSANGKAPKNRPAGHLYLGSICSQAANARDVRLCAPKPLDNPAWAAQSADDAAELYCEQCLAHIFEEYLVRWAAALSSECDVIMWTWQLALTGHRNASSTRRKSILVCCLSGSCSS
jgi:hypothetical protein